MTSRTAWTAGNGVGYTWTTAINSADLSSMPNGSTVLSSATAIANQTNQDMAMDLSVRQVIASSTIVAGAALSFYLYALLDDGSTYGDGLLPTPGTQVAVTPVVPCIGAIQLTPGASKTALLGYIGGILIPPGTFLLAEQNNSGFALTSGTQVVKYRTYNINLNN